LGETGAALDARVAAEMADDPLIAAAYERIAADEQRHAELAFRFLRWAFEQDRQAVAERLLAVQQTRVWSTHSARALVAPCFEALIASTQVRAA
jgi:rubrerythrin